MCRDVERRMTPRRKSPRVGVILLERNSIVACTIRDFSPAGVGLMLPDVSSIPEEFDLTFIDVTHRSAIAWRQGDRMGLKFKLVFDSRRDKALWIAVALLGASM
jgi:hypothetical protein